MNTSPLPKGIHALFVLPLFAVLASVPNTLAQTIVGQVTDASTGFGIEGALVAIDFNPTDGVPEATAISNLFGYYHFHDLQAGTDFSIEAAHPAYQSESLSEQGVDPGETRTLSFTLNRSNPETTILDVQVSVRAINPGVALENVPVHAWRYSTEDGSDTADLRTTRTDADGNAYFRGFEAGYFQFSVNEPSDTPVPFYESYPNPAGRTPLTPLETDHLLTALLKHEPQSLTIRVLGFDPVSRNVTSLKGATVELTGLDADQTSRIVPTRTSETDEAGRVVFEDLPPIDWEVKVKLLGYDTLIEIVEADSSGALPSGDQNLTLQVQPRSLALTLNAVGYENVDWLFENIPVTLEGIAGTNTEGITREESAPGNFTGQERKDERLFHNLIPGRYRASISGQSDLASYYPLPVFTGSGIIELTDDVLFEGALTTSDGIYCRPAPARIRGRVFAAEDMMERDGSFVPRYLPKAMSGVRFGEVEGNVQVNLLPQDQRVTEFDTDDFGYYSISLTPSVYGISIPDATDYWGDHVDWKDETAGTGISQGWPYPETWPFAFPVTPPRGYAQWPSLPLVLESGHEYVVDIYIHKQRGVLQYFYSPDNDAPMRELLVLPNGNGPITPEEALYDDLGTPDTNGVRMQVTATPDSGEDPFSAEVKGGRVTFLNLPSGNYDIEASHPGRYTFASRQHSFPDWQPPGVLPTAPPDPLGVNTNQPLHVTNLGNDRIEADYITGTSTLAIRIRSWSEQSETYSDPNPIGFETPIWVQLPDQHGAVFEAQGREMPQAPFKFWIPFNGSYWEDEVTEEGQAKEITLFAGGPDNVAPNSPGPSQVFRVLPKAVFAPDPDFLIPDATFAVNDTEVAADGKTAVTVEGGLANMGEFTVPAGWIKENEITKFVSATGIVTIDLTATYVKQMVVSVVLEDSVDETPISEAAVRIRSAAGGRLTSTGLPSIPLTHLGDGAFAVTDFSTANALISQECLVEVEAPGYKPLAKRVIPDGLPTPAVLNLEAALERLPLPKINSAEINRYGLFIPGIKLTGNESAFDDPPPPDQDPFIAGWSANGESATPFTVTLETVDGDPEANENNEVTRTISDAVATVYLIDSRAFDGNPNDPETSIIPSKASDPERPASLRDWIRRVEDGTLPDVVNQRVAAASPANSFDLGDSVYLPDLPPGKFEPGFVAMTTRGAGAFKPLPDYPGSGDTYRLEGAPLPNWMSFATNVLTGIAVTDANIAQAADFVPFGDYTPLDHFTAGVAMDEENSGFIDYTYEMGTEWSFGVPTPERGFLMFAPGVIGINATATTRFGSRGYDRDLFLETEGDAQNEPAELKKKRLPAFFRRNPETNFEGQVTITAANTINRSYNVNEPYELEVRTALPETPDGKVTGFSFKLTRPLDDVVLRIPAAGPKLRLLAAAGILNHTGTIEGLIGLTADVTFRTPRPPPFPDPGTTHPVDDLRANRRHLFGGSVVSASFAPQMSFSGKVTSSVTGGVIEADLGVSLSGNRSAGKRFASIEVNPFSDWPWVKRVSGGLNLDLAGRVNAYIWEGEKTFSWQALPFDFQLGTQSVFALTPISVIQRRIGLGDTGSATVNGQDTQAFTNVNPLTKFDIALSPTPLLIYSEFNSSENQVELLGLSRENSGWGSPLVIGSAAATTSLTSLRLPDGRILIAWAAIPEASIGILFPETEIYYTVQGLDSEWSDPALAASLSGTAVELLPIEADTFSGLVVAESAEGPGGRLRIRGLPWTGEGFGPIQSDSQPRECLTLEAVGSSTRGIIYCVAPSGLTEITWDGSSFTVEPLDAAITTGPISAARSANGSVYRATSQDGSIWIDGFGESVAQLNTGASSMEMIVLPGDPETVLLVWAESGTLRTAWFNADTGALLKPIETITRSDNGSYSQLKVIPGDEGTATIVSKYRANDTIELREFEIAPSGSAALNDSDNDGLDDLSELRIIDADTSDAINTLAEVLASDDFDLDGISNGDEISQGTDPTISEFNLPDNDLEITTILYAPDGRVAITITSFPGTSYLLQTSDLVSDWENVESKVATDVLITFYVDGAGTQTAFYRITKQ